MSCSFHHIPFDTFLVGTVFHLPVLTFFLLLGGVYWRFPEKWCWFIDFFSTFKLSLFLKNLNLKKKWSFFSTLLTFSYFLSIFLTLSSRLLTFFSMSGLNSLTCLPPLLGHWSFLRKIFEISARNLPYFNRDRGVKDFWRSQVTISSFPHVWLTVCVLVG